jgi:hypothetical protein
MYHTGYETKTGKSKAYNMIGTGKEFESNRHAAQRS